MTATTEKNSKQNSTQAGSTSTTRSGETIQATGTFSGGSKKAYSKRLIKQASQDYVFSWSWFLGGVVFLAVVILSALGLHAFFVSTMSTQIVRMSEELEKQAEEATDVKKEELLQQSIDVLTSYLEASPNSPDVYARQCSLYEKMYKENRFTSMGQLHRAIRHQKTALGFLSPEESLEIQKRIMDMEMDMVRYEPKYLTNAVLDAKSILKVSANDPKALRILALSVYMNFVNGVLPVPGDPEVDIALRNALAANPGDLELSVNLANCIRSVGPTSLRSVSTKLFSATQEDRNQESLNIINEMVQRNPSKVEAYLNRFQFRAKYRLLDTSAKEMDPDLAKALELNPNNPLTLRMVGLQLFFVSRALRSSGNATLAEEKRDSAINFLLKAIDLNPKDEGAYLQLGEIYASEKQMEKAEEIWRKGIMRIAPRVARDLHAQLTLILIEQKKFDDATKLIEELYRYRVSAQSSLNPQQMLEWNVVCQLLRAKLYFAQGTEAAELRVKTTQELQNKGGADPALEKIVRDSGTEAENKFSAARVLIRDTDVKLLGEGKEYDLSGSSILSRLEGESMITLGRLELQNGALDTSAKYFEKAMRFPQQASIANMLLASVLQQNNQQSRSVEVLAAGAKNFPDNASIRFAYVSSLFQREIAKRDGTRNFDLIESELNEIDKIKSTLPQPWMVEVMRVQLQYVKEGGTVQAQQQALTKLRELENDPTYSQEFQFLARIADQYSTIGALNDFNRVVEKLKTVPDGQNAYYLTRINDALRREDKAEALRITDEAVAALPEKEKTQFLTLKRRIENPAASRAESLESHFQEMKGLWEQGRIFDPKTFFELANLAFSRGETDLAKNIEDRLKSLEKADGVYWRFLMGRRLLKQADSSQSSLLEEARTLQKEIATVRPDWDMTNVLLAEIETRAGRLSEAAIAYKRAIEQGRPEPEVFRDYISILFQLGRFEEAETVRRRAVAVYGSAFSSQEGIFPPPFQGFYEQIFKAVSEGNLGVAEKLADDCMKKAVESKVPSDLLVELNTRIGKLFVDSGNPEIAQRFLENVAKLGGQYVYPLAVCLAKMNKIDDAFELIVREVEKPEADMNVLRMLLWLYAQVKPSEAMIQKIDRTMLGKEADFVKDMPTLLALADYWTTRNNPEPAIRVYRQGLAREPENLLILNNLSLLLASRGQSSPAPIAKGQFTSDAPKNIPFAQPRSTQSLILRFPGLKEGEQPPKAEDFHFMGSPTNP